jgi:hypothetical protein
MSSDLLSVIVMVQRGQVSTAWGGLVPGCAGRKEHWVLETAYQRDFTFSSGSAKSQMNHPAFLLNNINKGTIKINPNEAMLLIPDRPLNLLFLPSVE